jgi:hypothetical protein
MNPDSRISPEPADGEKNIEVFKKRRTVQRVADGLYLVLICALIGLAVSLSQSGTRPSDLLWIAGVFLGLTIARAVLAIVTWRCPACAESLAGPRVRIDSWFTPEPLDCPYCGTKLL